MQRLQLIQILLLLTSCCIGRPQGQAAVNTTQEPLQFSDDLPKPHDRRLTYGRNLIPRHDLPKASVYMAAMSGLYLSGSGRIDTADTAGTWYDVSDFKVMIRTEPILGASATISDRMWTLESVIESLPSWAGDFVPAKSFTWGFRWESKPLINGGMTDESASTGRNGIVDDKEDGSGVSMHFYPNARDIGVHLVFTAAVLAMKSMAVRNKEEEVTKALRFRLSGQGAYPLVLGIEPSYLPFSKPLYWQDVGTIVLLMTKYLTRDGRWDELFGYAVDGNDGRYAYFFIEYEDRDSRPATINRDITS